MRKFKQFLFLVVLLVKNVKKYFFALVMCKNIYKCARTFTTLQVVYILKKWFFQKYLDSFRDFYNCSWKALVFLQKITQDFHTWKPWISTIFAHFTMPLFKKICKYLMQLSFYLFKNICTFSRTFVTLQKFIFILVFDILKIVCLSETFEIL